MFKTPAALARHANRKTPCRPVAGARIEGALAVAPQGLKKEVWKARDIMRRGGVTGLESLDCLLMVLFLREFEKLHPGVADPSSFPEVGALPPDSRLYLAENKVHTYSKMAATPEHDGNRRDWSVVIRAAFKLCQKHPSANGALEKYEADPLFTLRDSACAYALLKTCAYIAFEAKDDAFGSAYQSVIKDFLDGKELGQFFTPKCATQYLSGAARDGRASLGIVCDPTCGSGGFLAAAQISMTEQAVGYEIDNRVRMLATFQTLLMKASTGVTGDVYQRDSLRVGNDQGEAFDTVLANPPFGVKGVRHEELLATPGGPACYPFKTSVTGFFLQKIVHILKVGGRACVVLPLGKELASRAASEARFRRALLRSLNIREIVAIPSNAFENTGIRTVGLVFDKVHPLGGDIGLKGKKTAELSSPLVTEKILLRRLRTAEDGGKTVLPESEPIPNTLEEVTPADLERMAWSLSPDDYRVGGGIGGPAMGVAGSVYPMVPLGELFTLKKGGTYTTKASPGPYPLYTSAQERLTSASYDENSKALLIACEGTVGQTHVAKEARYAVGHRLYVLRPINPDIYEEYVDWFIRTYRKTLITEYARGAVTQTLNAERISSLEIPLPPLEAQQAIAAELDAQAAALAGLEKAAEAVEKAKKVALENALYARGHLRGVSGSGELADGVRMVPLGELFTLKKGSVQATKAVPGEYDFISVPTAFRTHETCCFPGDSLVMVTASVGCNGIVHYAPRPFACSTITTAMCPKSNAFHVKYIAWVLQMNRKTLADMQAGVKDTLQAHKIEETIVALPSLEVQQAIAAELDALDSTAKGLKAAAAAAKETMRVTLAKALAPGAPPPAKVEADGEEVEPNETEPPAESSSGGTPPPALVDSSSSD